MTTDRVGMEVLDAEECRTPLRVHPVHVGRVGFTADDGAPVVLPVNFRLDGDDVVMRTGEGAILAAVRAGRPLAFQADQLDPAWQDGWSVRVQGVATEITGIGELERTPRLPLQPWAPGHKSHWLRLPTDRISGPRIL